MAKKLGNDYRIWIESSTAGTYNQILGQTNLSLSRSSTPIDTSTKDDYPYGTQAAGLKQLSIDCEVYPNLPDTTGYTRLETLAQGTSAVNFQIRKDGSSGDSSDVVFQGSMYIQDLNNEFGKNDVVKATFKLTAAGTPTTDALA